MTMKTKLDPKANAVTFKALLKEISVKSLVSGDKAARITLEVNEPDADMIDALNRSMRADALVNVGIWK
jgi:hypothetical protein